MRSPAVVRVDADTDHLATAQQARNQVEQLMDAYGQELVVSHQRTGKRTFKPAMTSRTMGKFQAIKIATNMTQAAIMVFVSAVSPGRIGGRTKIIRRRICSS